MKILMLNYEFPPVGGGASPVTLQLCRQLVLLGHHVDVVTMRYDRLPPFELIDGINVYRTPAIRKRPDICRIHEMLTYPPGAFFTAKKLLKKHRHDIIHCHFIIPTGLLAWALSRLTSAPYIITCHGSDVEGYNPDRFRLAHKLISPAWKVIVRGAAVVISPSNALRQMAAQKCPGVRFEVIPNGIELSRFTAQPKTKSILLCSRLLPRKGFQHVIEAVRDLTLDWELNIIGDGPYMEKLKTLAQGSKTKINFLGWLDHNDQRFRTLYQTSAIFVFPSQAENFPSVLLEAMAAGMAIITSDTGGCPEVVGDAAILVKPADTAAIRNAIVTLINSDDLRRQLAENTANRLARFAWPVVAKSYLDCYNTVLETRQTR